MRWRATAAAWGRGFGFGCLLVLSGCGGDARQAARVDATEQALEAAQEMMDAEQYAAALQRLESLVDAGGASSGVLKLAMHAAEREGERLIESGQAEQGGALLIRGGQLADQALAITSGSVPPGGAEEFAEIYFQQACGYAGAGEIDSALGALKKAVRYEFSNLGRLNSEEQLAEVRQAPGFEEIVSLIDARTNPPPSEGDATSGDSPEETGDAANAGSPGDGA